MLLLTDMALAGIRNGRRSQSQQNLRHRRRLFLDHRMGYRIYAPLSLLFGQFRSQNWICVHGTLPHHIGLRMVLRRGGHGEKHGGD